MKFSSFIILVLLNVINFVWCQTEDFYEQIKKKQEESQKQFEENSNGFLNQNSNISNNNNNVANEMEKNRETVNNIFDIGSKTLVVIGIVFICILISMVVCSILIFRRMGKMRKRTEEKMDRIREDRKEFLKNGGIIVESYNYGYRYY